MNKLHILPVIVLIIVITSSNIVVNEPVSNVLTYEFYFNVHSDEWPIYAADNIVEIYNVSALAEMIANEYIAVIHDYNFENLTLWVIDYRNNITKKYFFEDVSSYDLTLYGDKAILITSPINVVRVLGLNNYYNITINETFNHYIGMTCYGNRLYLVYSIGEDYVVGYIWLNTSTPIVNFIELGRYPWHYFKSEGFLRHSSIWYLGEILVYLDRGEIRELRNGLTLKYQAISPNGELVVGISIDDETFVYNLSSDKLIAEFTPDDLSVDYMLQGLYKIVWVNDTDVLLPVGVEGKTTYYLLHIGPNGNITGKILGKRGKSSAMSWFGELEALDYMNGYIVAQYSMFDIGLAKVYGDTFTYVEVILDTYNTPILDYVVVDNNLLILLNGNPVKLIHMIPLDTVYRPVLTYAQVKLYSEIEDDDLYIHVNVTGTLDDPDDGRRGSSSWCQIKGADQGTGMGLDIKIVDNTLKGSAEFFAENFNLTNKYNVTISITIYEYPFNTTSSYIMSYAKMKILEVDFSNFKPSSITTTPSTTKPSGTNTSTSPSTQKTSQTPGVKPTKSTTNTTKGSTTAAGELDAGIVLAGLLLVLVLSAIVILVTRKK